jgi:uncharacterized protein (TIGR00369 family)
MKPPLPQSAGFEQHIRAQLQSSPVFRFFGFAIDEVTAGNSALSTPARTEFGHRPGFFQGAIMGAIADYSGAIANMTLAPADWTCLTLDYTIKFLAPACGARLIGRGRTISAGTTICVAISEIFVERDGAETLCATALVTTRHAPAREEATP